MRARLPQVAVIPDELYVLRDADRQLASVVMAMGRPAYVLDPRQMGKTNLLLHARRSLECAEVRFIYADLSFRPGSIFDFYSRVLEIGAKAHPDVLAPSVIQNALSLLGPIPSDLDVIRTVEDLLRSALREWPGKLVIVLDEIDALTTKPYSDRVFAHIRSFYFVRKDNPEFHRLTFVLSGVAEPTQLIRDKSISPFNIGQKIFLRDFTAKEFDELVSRSGLPFDAVVRERVLYWTSGNPRLTWDVAAALDIADLEGRTIDAVEVDRTVERLYLTSFDQAPVDHIRALVESNPALRRSVKHLKDGDELPDRERALLHLAGVATATPGSRHSHFRSRIIEESLSDQWLGELEKEAAGRLLAARASYDARDYFGAVERYGEYFTNEPVTELLGADLLKCSNACRALGRYEEALEWMERLAQVRPGGPDSMQLNRMGGMRLALGRVDEAERDYRAVLDKQEDGTARTVAAAAIASLLVDTGGDRTEAKALAKQVIYAEDAFERVPPRETQGAVGTALRTLATLSDVQGERLALLHRAAEIGDGPRKLSALAALAMEGAGESDIVIASGLVRELAKQSGSPEEEMPAYIETGLALAMLGGGRLLQDAVEIISGRARISPGAVMHLLWNEAESSTPQVLSALAREVASPWGSAVLDETLLRSMLARWVLHSSGDVESKLAAVYLSSVGRTPGDLTSVDHYALMMLMPNAQSQASSEYAEWLFETAAELRPPSDPRLRQSFALVRYVQVFGALKANRHDEAIELSRDVLLLIEEIRRSPVPNLSEGVMRGIEEALAKLPFMGPRRPPHRNDFKSIGRNDVVTVRYRDGNRRTAKFKHVKGDLVMGACDFERIGDALEA